MTRLSAQELAVPHSNACVLCLLVALRHWRWSFGRCCASTNSIALLGPRSTGMRTNACQHTWHGCALNLAKVFQLNLSKTKQYLFYLYSVETRSSYRSIAVWILVHVRGLPPSLGILWSFPKNQVVLDYRSHFVPRISRALLSLHIATSLWFRRRSAFLSATQRLKLREDSLLCWLWTMR